MLGYLIIGLTAGFASALFGIGGGLLVVPMLTVFYHFDPKNAVGTSLAAMVLTALAGALQNWKIGRVDFQGALWIAVGSVPFTFLGTYVKEFIPAKTFEKIFGLLIILVALKLLYPPFYTLSFWKNLLVLKK